MCKRLPDFSAENLMTDSGQIQKEATVMTREALNTAKTKIKIGFWNVRTMYEAGKLATVIKEMNAYKLHLLGVSETRWTKSGKLKISSGETVLYSGREDDQHHEGVAIILRKGLEKSLLEWKPISSRIISARLKGRHTNLTIMQCYAPTNDSEVEIKESFYDQLQSEIVKTPQHDTIIVIGDFNAKVGQDNENFENSMGNHGCVTMNENGEMLANFSSYNNLVIGGTMFPHKDIHICFVCFLV